MEPVETEAEPVPLQELIDRKAAAEEELSEVKRLIAARHGETDESLDPDEAKANPVEPVEEPAEG